MKAAESAFRGLNGLDRHLAEHLDLSRPGFFVELGANDGLRQSNTYFLEQVHGWRGVLIEPALNNYLDLIRNRSTENEFFCAACVSFDHAEEFVRLTYANLMSVSVSLEMDLPDAVQHIREGSQFLRDDREIVDFGAVARPLSDILSEAEAPSRIDLLSLDVEGAEMEVLRGVDHWQHRFDRIVVECRDVARLDAYLGEAGYRRVAQLSVHDYLYADDRDAVPASGDPR
jgi:FkbM family methyltransferase